jgi:Flp pilus assembly protein TadD
MSSAQSGRFGGTPRHGRDALVCVAALLLLSACATSRAPRPQPSAEQAGRLGAPEESGTTARRHAPHTAAHGNFEETEIGEVAELKPPPSTEEILPEIEPNVVPTAAEPEPLVSHIGPSTPPNVAAAIRLIEEGRQQRDSGHYDQAVEAFERAVAIDPTNAYGYYFLAQVHYLKKNYDQAIAFASRAAVLSARLDRACLGRVYSLQGAVFEEVGRYPDARKAYRRAVDADPNNLAARVGVARLAETPDQPMHP